MSNLKNPEHLIQFDAFLASVNAIEKTALIRNTTNWKIIRAAALQSYQLPDEDSSVITKAQYQAVYLWCRDKLTFAEPEKPKPQTDFGLDADGNPVKPFQRSAYQSQSDKDEWAAKRDKERADAVKSLQATQAAKAERLKRESDLKQTIFFETGVHIGKVDWSKTYEAREKAADFYHKQDRERGIKNAD